MNNLFACLVCGWPGMERPQAAPFGSHDICACCGTQYGLDVATVDDIVSVRTDWLNDGAPWFDTEVGFAPPKPNDWSRARAEVKISQACK